MVNKSTLDTVIGQIGAKYLPKGMKINQCMVHGSYLSHYKAKDPSCPLCPIHNPEAEGTTATQVEHFLDAKEAMKFLPITVTVI